MFETILTRSLRYRQWQQVNNLLTTNAQLNEILPKALLDAINTDFQQNLAEALLNVSEYFAAEETARDKTKLIFAEQQYLRLLAQEDCPAILMPFLLLQLSELALSQQNYRQAMQYAAAARVSNARASDDSFLKKWAIAQCNKVIVTFSTIILLCPEDVKIWDWQGSITRLKLHRNSMTLLLEKSNPIDIIKKNTAFFKNFLAGLIDHTKTISINLDNENLNRSRHQDACIGLGSLGRGEMNLFSDLEFAWVIAQDDDNDLLKRYYYRLTQLLELYVIALGETPIQVLANGQSPVPKGLCFDDGRNTPLGEGAAYPADEFPDFSSTLIGTPASLSRWQSSKEEAHTIARHALRTACFLTGDNNLFTQYETHLWQVLHENVAAEPSIFHSMGLYKVYRYQQLALSTLAEDLTTYSPEAHIDKKIRQGQCSVNIKSELYRLLSQGLNHLALFYGIREKSTRERLDRLWQTKHISPYNYKLLAEIVNKVLRWRLTCHAYYECEEEGVYYETFIETPFSINNKIPYMLSQDDIKNLNKIYKILLPFEKMLKLFLEEKKRNGQSPFHTNILYESTEFASLQKLNQYQEAKNYYQQKLHDDLHNTENHLAWINYLQLEQHYYQEIAQGVLRQSRGLLQQIIALLADSAELYEVFYEKLPNAEFKNFFYQLLPEIVKNNTLAIEQKETALADLQEYWLDQLKNAEKPLSVFHSTKSFEEQILLLDKLAISRGYFSNEQTHVANNETLSAHGFNKSNYLLSLWGMIRIYACYRRYLNAYNSEQTPKQDLKVAVKTLAKLMSKQKMPLQTYVENYQNLSDAARIIFRKHLLKLYQQGQEKALYLKEVLKALYFFPNKLGERAIWLDEKAKWENHLRSLVSKEQSQGFFISALFPGKQWLKQEIEEQLFTSDGEFKGQKINESGRQVIHIKSETGNYFGKLWAEMPGMTYLVEQLHFRLIGYGTSFSELIHIQHTKNPDGPLPLLLSQEVQGPTLEKVLEKEPEKLEKLNLRYFADIALVAMIINPEDGLPTNYIVVKLPDTEEYALVSIDHDHALFPAWLILLDPTTREQQCELQVRTILFCLEQMRQPVPEEVKKAFLALNPNDLLHAWLYAAQKQNDAYKKMFDPETLSRWHKSRMGGQTTIPIPLKSGDTTKIYYKILRLQELLRNNPEVTLFQCLIHLEPRVGLVYQKAFDEDKNPLKRLKKAGNFPLDPQGVMLSHTRAIKSLSLRTTLLQQDNYIELKDLSPEEGLAELDIVSYQQTILEEIKQEVQTGDFKRFQELKVAYQQELIVFGNHESKTAGINWRELSKQKQLELLQLLQGNAFSHISIAGFAQLAAYPGLFYNFLRASTDLLSIKLLDCGSLTSYDINRIASLCPILQQATFQGLPQVIELKGQWPELRMLNVLGLPLISIDISAPKLTHLRAQDCQELLYLQTDTQNLRKLDIRGCTQLELDEILGNQGIRKTVHTLLLAYCKLAPEHLTGDWPELCRLDISNTNIKKIFIRASKLSSVAISDNYEENSEIFPTIQLEEFTDSCITHDATKIIGFNVDNIFIYNALNGKKLHQLKLCSMAGKPEKIVDFNLCSQKEKLIALGEWGTIQIWDIATAKTITIFSINAEDGFRPIFNDDGTQYAKICIKPNFFCTIYLWEVPEGIQITEQHQLKVDKQTLNSTIAKFSNNSGVTNFSDKISNQELFYYLKIVNQNRWLITWQYLKYETESVHNNRFVISTWDIETKKMIHRAFLPSYMYDFLTISQDGLTVMYVDYTEKTSIQVLNIRTRSILLNFIVHNSRLKINNLEFSHDNRWILCSHSHAIKIYDKATGQLQQEIPHNLAGIARIYFSTNGQYVFLIENNNRTFEIWQWQQGAKAFILKNRIERNYLQPRDFTKITHFLPNFAQNSSKPTEHKTVQKAPVVNKNMSFFKPSNAAESSQPQQPERTEITTIITQATKEKPLPNILLTLLCKPEITLQVISSSDKIQSNTVVIKSTNKRSMIRLSTELDKLSIGNRVDVEKEENQDNSSKTELYLIRITAKDYDIIAGEGATEKLTQAQATATSITAEKHIKYGY